MLRIDCLGSDHDGAHYFALPEAVESDGDSDDDADDDDDAPAAPEQKKAERVRLIVESRDGSVGRPPRPAAAIAAPLLTPRPSLLPSFRWASSRRRPS